MSLTLPDSRIKGYPLAHPDSTLCVVAQLRRGRGLALARRRIRVNQHGQGAAPNGQPCDERAKLSRREDVDLKHGHGVRADGAIPEAVDAQLGNCVESARE